jgi:gliding-associated putative ABC transporter substrate-binding component GldG
MKKRNVVIKILFISATLIVVNLISYRFFVRFDFTADKSFTLSNASRYLLKDLDSNLIIKAYFSEDLPTQLLKSREDFKHLLSEYKNYSRGKLSFEFINPNKNEQQEKNAQAQGVQPVIVNVSERDQVKQLRAYMGATIETPGRKESISMIRPGESAEFPLTMAIKRLTSDNKQKIAFLQGHGEYPSSACQQLYEQLAVSYQIEDYSISDSAEIPADYRTLIMFNPTDSIPLDHLNKINKYLAAGGNILIGFSGFYGSLNTNMVQRLPENGVREWLAQYGILISSQIVMDMQCRTVSMQEHVGTFSYSRRIKFPYFPVIKRFETHPVTKGIEAVFFPFLSTINIIRKDSVVQITPLAYTSNKTGLVKSPLLIDINKQWSALDFNLQPQIIALALDREISGKGKSRMIVIANGNFAVNTEPGQSELNVDNINFASNAIDWLSDDIGLIDLRTKSVTFRPLENIEDSTKELVKYINVFFPIILIIGFGLGRKYGNIKKRRKLIQTIY